VGGRGGGKGFAGFEEIRVDKEEKTSENRVASGPVQLNWYGSGGTGRAEIFRRNQIGGGGKRIRKKKTIASSDVYSTLASLPLKRCAGSLDLRPQNILDRESESKGEKRYAATRRKIFCKTQSFIIGGWATKSISQLEKEEQASSHAGQLKKNSRTKRPTRKLSCGSCSNFHFS